MLDKSIKAMEQLNTSDHKDLFTNVECWIKKEENYNLYVFSALLENELDLEKLWTKLTNAIAVFFQGELEKEIEIWNIYILFLVKEKVSRDLKYRIEQDKYSTRKIVLDNIKDIDLSTSENYSALVESRLFVFNLTEGKGDSSDIDNKMLIDIIREQNQDLYDVILKYPNDKSVTQFIKYLG